jgi:hypothetical protein
MVVAPEAILELSSIGSNILSSRLSSFIILVFISSGARLALPMGVSPEVIRGCLQPFIESNIPFERLLFLEL